MNTPSNAGKEHNPDGLTPEQVGEGWRLLGPDEIQQPGDEWWNKDHHGWQGNPKEDTGLRVTCDDTGNYLTYRRRTTPPTQSQEGETPETDAYFAPLIANQSVLSRFVYTKDVDFAKRLESERNAAQRENDRLRSEVAELKADKERIDWLEKDWNIEKTHRDAMSGPGVFFVDNHTSEVGIRAAIDAARAATEEGK